MKKSIFDSCFLTAINTCIIFDASMAMIMLCLLPFVKLFPALSNVYLFCVFIMVGFCVIMDIVFCTTTLIFMNIEKEIV